MQSTRPLKLKLKFYFKRVALFMVLIYLYFYTYHNVKYIWTYIDRHIAILKAL